MSQFDSDNTKFIKYSDNLNNFYYFQGAFDDNDIARLDAQMQGNVLEEGNVSGIVDKSYRDSRIHWIPKTPEWDWLYSKIGLYAYKANNAMWNFDISFMNEQIQYTEYDASYSGKYDWHVDFGSGSSSMRKIAIVVQLSDESEYEGGDLQFYTSKSVTTVTKVKGTIACFPTYFLHRVTPVTKGKRRSLVLWISGNPFR
jgi:PKHD-type hydroxylase